MAVPLLIFIAAVLAWGTIYETRFGTASVQRFVYGSWWFQGLLGFLAVNLAAAALERYPWKRKHVPFVLAHIGIILILLGGILGGRFGIEGQLVIPEGEADNVLQLPRNVLTVRQPNPGVTQVFPTRFETQAWVREPQAVFPVTVDRRDIRLIVDRYYPDAVTDEEITGDGTDDNPAAHILMRDGGGVSAIGPGGSDAFWLLARDPDRFSAGRGESQVLFVAPNTEEQLRQLLHPGREGSSAPRGTLVLQFEGGRPIEIPVPAQRGRTIPVKGTPYRLTFKDYFPDFVISEEGLMSRSSEPNNPAVSFTLEGPEGVDPYLLFALHPDISAMHGWQHRIRVQASYQHVGGESLPPNAVVLLHEPDGALAAVLTGPSGERRTLDSVASGTWYPHPWLGDEFSVDAHYPRARVAQHIRNRSDEVKAEALHLTAQEGSETAEAWVGLRGSASLALGKEPVAVEYRPAQRELPFTIKLMDFRKFTYPGIDMAEGFESDVQLTDSKRGLILMRKISMNHPLRYRGYSLFQSSYIDGEPQTTVLSVRNDPGCPLVYAGFLIVIAGVVTMFIQHSKPRRKGRR